MSFYNDVFASGYAKDFADALAKEVGFDYIFRLVKDGSYGDQLDGANNWTGMVGELIRRVGIGLFVLTSSLCK